MRTRVITAVIALAIFIPLLIIGGIPLTLAAFVLAIVAIDEILIMKKILLVSFEAILVNIGILIMVIPNTWVDFSNINRLFCLYIIAMLLLVRTVTKKVMFTFDDASVLTLAMLYIGMGFKFFVDARTAGLSTLLYGMFIVWITDSGAYMIGRQLGRHKLAPKVSPNKTWEGSIGGTVAATIIMSVYLYFFPGRYDLPLMILITLLLSIVGQFGDLIESALKRFYGVKDSGKILPGHGGILDRFDSMLLVMPMMHLFGLI